MTKIFNDPADFTQEALSGFTSLYPQYVLQVPGGVIRAKGPTSEKVCVVVGGGSGHYPAFCGVVGTGFADGAVVGNVFTSPSAEDAYGVAKAAWANGGLLFITGNYAGDVMNFNQAAKRLQEEGLDVRTFYVTDDIASAPIAEIQKRRGIAGDFTVFRVAGAAGDAGYKIDDVERVAKKANDFTRTLGIGLNGCTLPGANAPLFEVTKGQMGLGLGIHGEPGISDEALPPAKGLAKQLVSGVLKEIKIENGSHIAVIVNGLGATKYEELFILWNEIQQLLVAKGFTIVDPEVGELVTSLDMAGCSLTIMTLDDELENLWTTPTDTPAYRKGVATINTDTQVKFKRENYTQDKKSDIPIASQPSKDCGKIVVEALQIINQVMVENEQELGRIDAVAGDGDHGRGMVKGSTAAYKAGIKAMSESAGAGSILVLAGKDFAAKAGGTSGVLWGAALEAVGKSLGDTFTSISKADISIAISAGAEAIQVLGRANLGDKTMLDCLIPFTKSLNDNIPKMSLSDSWKAAANVAITCAQETSKLSPKIGRARPLASKSIGTPDAGATSMSLALNSLTMLIDKIDA